jgi:hypothetical protein
MLKTVAGTFKRGKIRLTERPPGITEAPVLVTFLSQPTRNRRPKLRRAEAAELRGKLAAWEEDWNAPGMELYDQS